MSWTSRVVWREGMFLRPQHFQQQDRYLHHLLESRVNMLRPFDWGVGELELDASQLAKGVLRIARCTGIFDDGTPFEIPLVIRDPRLPRRGKINEVVRSIDLAPTLLQLMGIRPPAAMEARSLLLRELPGTRPDERLQPHQLRGVA